MARPCTVCRHPGREAIEAAMHAGEPADAVARGFTAMKQNVSGDAILRHMENHTAGSIVRVAELLAERRTESLSDEILRKKREAEELQVLATADGDYRTSLAAIKVYSDLVSLLLNAAAVATAGPDDVEVVLRLGVE